MMRLAKFHQRISTPSLEPKVNQGWSQDRKIPSAAQLLRTAHPQSGLALILGAFPKKETELNFHMISLAPIGCRKLAIELVVDIIQSLDAEVSSSASGSELGNQDK